MLRAAAMALACVHLAGCDSLPPTFRYVPQAQASCFVGTYRNWEQSVLAYGPDVDSLWYLMTGESTNAYAVSEPIHVQISMRKSGDLEAHLFMNGIEVAAKPIKLGWHGGYLSGWQPDAQLVAAVVTVLGETKVKMGLDAEGNLVAYRFTGGTAFLGPLPLFGADNAGGRDKHFKREQIPDPRHPEAAMR
jgi:hypothetical protein